MTTLVDEPAATAALSPHAGRLRATMAAVRVAFTWFGTRKTLTPQQKTQAADAFGAEGTFLSAGKKLLDTSHAAYQAVTAVRGRILAYWKGISLPFPEPGIRLIRQAELRDFSTQMTCFEVELANAVLALDEHYAELQVAARRRLGRLYNPADYPASLRGLFAVAHEFPSVEPPEYLRELNPALFEQESERVAARFNEAVRLAEEAFTDEFSKLVAHLGDRLTGGEDGKPKVFRDSAVENLTEFFERFRALNIGSSAQLDQLVEQARRIVRGVAPQTLRDDQSLRQRVSTQLAGVQSVLDGLLVDRPRRNIQRNASRRPK
jgi:hypothetical protein